MVGEGSLPVVEGERGTRKEWRDTGIKSSRSSPRECPSVPLSSSGRESRSLLVVSRSVIFIHGSLPTKRVL